MTDVKVGDETRNIDEFSAYKGTLLLDLFGDFADAAPGIFTARARFRQEYREQGGLRLSRVEARRRFAPQPLHEEVPLERDGEIVREGDAIVWTNKALVDETGRPMMHDPLGSVTEEDWAASNNEYVVPGDPPTGWEEVTAVVKQAVAVARDQAFTLVAAVLLHSSEYERADDQGGQPAVDEAIAQEAKRLKHRMKLGQAVDVLFAAVEAIAAQLGDQLGDIGGRLGNLQAALGQATPAAADDPAPMHVETSTPPTSSDSGYGSAGDETRSSTEPSSETSPPSPDGSTSTTVHA